MHKKLLLVFILLIFSVILVGFSAFDVVNQDHTNESVQILNSTKPEVDLPESEPFKIEPVLEPETFEFEPFKIETMPFPEPELNDPETPPSFEVMHADTEQTPEPQTEPILEPEPKETELEPLVSLVQKNYSVPVSNSINFFRKSTVPEALLWLDVMYRRFGIEVFADSVRRFNEVMFWYPEQSNVDLFSRIVDYHRSINAAEIEKVTDELDRITLPALYCDRLDFPTNYSTLLQNGVSKGGYQLTHVLLAWIWIQENGGEIELPDGFIDNMYQANAALINSDSTTTDLEMEAAAFLCLAGERELVDDSFVDWVIASQAVDGSWGEKHSWHSTVLGLLFLLHVEFPCDDYPPVLVSYSD